VSYSFGLTIESLVAILLLLTIIYCARLNSRLEKLRANEGSMKASVAELVAATEMAQRAIGGLKATVQECREAIDPRLKDGDTLSADLADKIRAGEQILAHLRTIATARPSSTPLGVEPFTPPKPAAPASDTRAMVAAAQAFAERTRTRTRNGFAA
jgi:hypothetical protein